MSIIIANKLVSFFSTGTIMWRVAGWVAAGLGGILLGSAALGQTESYSDVAVVINSNSAISDSIGEYFAACRAIPSSNILRIIVPVSEEIDSLQFEDLRSQVEQLILSRGLQDKINYIVTTKGMPLKVLRSSSFSCSSVESELTLILSKYAGSIGGYGNVVSPYYGQEGSFSRAKYGIYLVTRLDGYSFNDVRGIIDRASAAPTAGGSGGTFVFDEDPLWAPLAGFLNTNMAAASACLQGQNVITELDTTTSFVMHESNVLGYVSWGSNDHNPIVSANHAIPCNTYLPGAIAETYVSTSARSFDLPRIYGQSLIGDLIAEGMTGAKGYVYEPYACSMAAVELLFPMYYSGSTLAESFYNASPFLSWMDVVIGDPKCRLNASKIPASVLPVNLASLTAVVYGSSVTIEWSTAGEVGNYGFEVQRALSSDTLRPLKVPQWSTIGFVYGKGTTNLPQHYVYVDNVSRGEYAYRLRQIGRGGNIICSREVDVTVQPVAGGYQLAQNFPNPFNPSTTISFVLRESGNALVKVYDVRGRLVRTLFDARADAGRLYVLNFEAEGTSSGTYFSVLEAGDKREVRKMTLVR